MEDIFFYIEMIAALLFISIGISNALAINRVKKEKKKLRMSMNDRKNNIDSGIDNMTISELECKTFEQKRILTEFFFGKKKDENQNPFRNVIIKILKFLKVNINENNVMTGQEYGELVKNKVAKLDIKQTALEKLGIDESEVQEIKPVRFGNYYIGGNSLIKDNYSSQYQITMLFFSDKQIYTYKYIFDMTSDTTEEITGEYFYKDVTTLYTKTEKKEIVVPTIKGCLFSKVVYEKGSIDTASFVIVVPGHEFICQMKSNKENESIIQGMKQKLREKKN